MMSPAGIRTIIILIFVGLVVWLGRLTGAPLKKGAGKIFWLEISPNATAANQIIDQWKYQAPGQWQSLLLESLRWDDWFICAYAPLCYFLVWLAKTHLELTNPTASFWGHVLAAAQLFAGLCDFIENAGLRHMVRAGAASTPWPQITSVASVIKWALLALGALYCLFTLLHWLIIKPSPP